MSLYTSESNILIGTCLAKLRPPEDKQILSLIFVDKSCKVKDLLFLTTTKKKTNKQTCGIQDKLIQCVYNIFIYI